MNAALGITLLLITAALLAAVWKASRRSADARLDGIRRMPWADFYSMLAEAMRREGYVVEERAGEAPEKAGPDMVLRRNGKVIFVQCRRWKKEHVGALALKEIFAAMRVEQGDACLVLSSGRFTAEAVSFARNKPIVLADGKAMLELMELVRKERSRESRHFLELASLDAIHSQ